MMAFGLRIVTLGCHLLCMNLASAGPLLCVWLEWLAVQRSANIKLARNAPRPSVCSSDLLNRTSHRLALASLIGLQVGVLLGVAATYWLYYFHRVDYLQAALRLRPRLWWGVAEIAFSLGLLLIYAAWFRYGKRNHRWQRIMHRLVAIAAATNLLYHFPPLFSVLSELAQTDGNTVLTSSDYRTWLLQPLIWAKTTHVWGASFAVAGIVLSYLVPAYSERETTPTPDTSAHVNPGSGFSTLKPDPTADVRALGACWCLGGTVAQVLTGTWIIVQLAPAQQYAVLGTDVAASALLGCSIFATFLALNWMSQAAFGRPSRKNICWIIGTVSMIVFLMSAALLRLQIGTN